VSDATGRPSAWLIVSEDEVVGIVSFKALPVGRCVEIGYGVAASRRGCGHATRAVSQLIDEAHAQGFTLVASTSPDNHASHAVLERNAFLRAGERVDVDEGPLWLWWCARARRATPPA
jgi:RimJ/RimL family protein N-acetyltransferase